MIPNLIMFLHNLRADIVELTGNQGILLRFQVEATTRPDNIVLEVVAIGTKIIPFVFEPGDEDTAIARDYILGTLKLMLADT